MTGNVGAVTTITGFPPGIATGTVYSAPSNATVTAAYSDFSSAYAEAFSDVTNPSTQTMADLMVNRTFVGNNVYTFPDTDVVTAANIELTFDAQSDSSKVFIIRITRDLLVNGPLTFTLANGAQAANIYWVVGRTATISSASGPVTWDGDILTGDAFTMSANPSGSAVLAGTINGCVLSQTAATLAGETVVNGCAAASEAPEPASAALLLLGVATLAFPLMKAKRRT